MPRETSRTIALGTLSLPPTSQAPHSQSAWPAPQNIPNRDFHVVSFSSRIKGVQAMVATKTALALCLIALAATLVVQASDGVVGEQYLAFLKG